MLGHLILPIRISWLWHFVLSWQGISQIGQPLIWPLDTWLCTPWSGISVHIYVKGFPVHFYLFPCWQEGWVGDLRERICFIGSIFFSFKIILHFRRTFFKQEVRKVVSPFKNCGKTWRGTHTPDEDKHHRQDFFIAKKIRKHYFPRIFTLRWRFMFDAGRKEKLAETIRCLNDREMCRFVFVLQSRSLSPVGNIKAKSCLNWRNERSIRRSVWQN